MKMPTLLCLVGVLLLASPANADFSLKVYKDAKAAGGDTWAGMRLYFLGASNAYGYANGVLLKKHMPPLFCPPQILALNGDNVIDILDGAIKATALTRGISDDTIIDFILLQGLMATFPCKP